MLDTSNFVNGSAMWSLSLVMTECSLSGCGQGHVSNFYIVDLENFGTASRRCTGDIHNSSVGQFVYDNYRTVEETRPRCGWVHMFFTHCLQPSNFITSICSGLFLQVVSAWQLARFQLTWCIVWSLSDNWASCILCTQHTDNSTYSTSAAMGHIYAMHVMPPKRFMWITRSV